jgi:hypothetical protein
MEYGKGSLERLGGGAGELVPLSDGRYASVVHVCPANCTLRHRLPNGIMGTEGVL